MVRHAAQDVAVLAARLDGGRGKCARRFRMLEGEGKILGVERDARHGHLGIGIVGIAARGGLECRVGPMFLVARQQPAPELHRRDMVAPFRAARRGAHEGNDAGGAAQHPVSHVPQRVSAQQAESLALQERGVGLAPERGAGAGQSERRLVRQRIDDAGVVELPVGRLRVARGTQRLAVGNAVGGEAAAHLDGTRQVLPCILEAALPQCGASHEEPRIGLCRIVVDYGFARLFSFAQTSAADGFAYRVEQFGQPRLRFATVDYGRAHWCFSPQFPCSHGRGTRVASQADATETSLIAV